MTVPVVGAGFSVPSVDRFAAGRRTGGSAVRTGFLAELVELVACHPAPVLKGTSRPPCHEQVPTKTERIRHTVYLLEVGNTVPRC